MVLLAFAFSVLSAYVFRIDKCSKGAQNSSSQDLLPGRSSHYFSLHTRLEGRYNLSSSCVDIFSTDKCSRISANRGGMYMVFRDNKCIAATHKKARLSSEPSSASSSPPESPRFAPSAGTMSKGIVYTRYGDNEPIQRRIPLGQRVPRLGTLGLMTNPDNGPTPPKPSVPVFSSSDPLCRPVLSSVAMPFERCPEVLRTRSTSSSPESDDLRRTRRISTPREQNTIFSLKELEVSSELTSSEDSSSSSRVHSPKMSQSPQASPCDRTPSRSGSREMKRSQSKDCDHLRPLSRISPRDGDDRKTLLREVEGKKASPRDGDSKLASSRGGEGKKASPRDDDGSRPLHRDQKKASPRSKLTLSGSREDQADAKEPSQEGTPISKTLSGNLRYSSRRRTSINRASESLEPEAALPHPERATSSLSLVGEAKPAIVLPRSGSGSLSLKPRSVSKSLLSAPSGMNSGPECPAPTSLPSSDAAPRELSFKDMGLDQLSQVLNRHFDIEFPFLPGDVIFVAAPLKATPSNDIAILEAFEDLASTLDVLSESTVSGLAHWAYITVTKQD